ncbi:tetratricopeptide repeat protein [Sphingomonas gei]|uniref:Tetratricopeptide repeat protein n=1 Tax=Sphingomonas gei TaxID=1395960 RepID=A0A4S1XGM7_9SPHN|nr:tetratricopeptide repeat protein [Sphingomonas gei]TGX55155.1 tetratricopeptide repeat protein [Sphingomonas gei]
MKRRALLVASVLAWAGVAQAEVLEITGEFPANNREASFLESISVDRFGGGDGAALQIAIERALGGSQFQLLAGRTGRDTAEGSISGSVSSGVDESSFTKKEKQCVSKDGDGKCTKEEQVEIRCKRRIIDIKADIRIVRNTDGRIVYSQPKPFREEVSWCPGGNAGRTAEDVIEGAIRDIAGSLRGDLVPHVDTYKIRVRESTKGLSKETANRFKGLVKLTKRDPRGACAGWEAMQSEAPGYPSLLFNLGLCAEQRGEYEQALSLYQDAAQAGANEGRVGFERATRLVEGRADAQERAKRRRG